MTQGLLLASPEQKGCATLLVTAQTSIYEQLKSCPQGYGTRNWYISMETRTVSNIELVLALSQRSKSQCMRESLVAIRDFMAMPTLEMDPGITATTFNNQEVGEAVPGCSENPPPGGSQVDHPWNNEECLQSFRALPGKHKVFSVRRSVGKYFKKHYQPVQFMQKNCPL